MYKHHRWDELLSEFRLVHEFNSGDQHDPIVKRAKFQTPASVRLFNNFEEHEADGSFSFRDPWYVDGNDDQLDILMAVTSPYVPTGKWDESTEAAFLNQAIESGKP